MFMNNDYKMQLKNTPEPNYSSKCAKNIPEMCVNRCEMLNVKTTPYMTATRENHSAIFIKRSLKCGPKAQ